VLFFQKGGRWGGGGGGGGGGNDMEAQHTVSGLQLVT